MRIFVTGATGFIGSAIVEGLIGAGYQVLGLARNDAAADALKRMGAEVHRGDLSTPESLNAGAQKCDGVIHTAYNHDWSQIAAAADMDRRAVETLGAALAGSARPLVIASAIGLLSPGHPTTEDDAGDPHSLGAVRIPSEEKALALASENVRSSIIRLPPVVHDRTKQGLVARMTALASQTGTSAYVRGGLNRDRRGRNRVARDRRGSRQTCERSCGLEDSRGSRIPLRFSCLLRERRFPGIQHENETGIGMESDGARLDRRFAGRPIVSLLGIDVNATGRLYIVSEQSLRMRKRDSWRC